MKLFFCDQCQDVVRMVGRWRRCECGKAAGRYVDTVLAQVTGTAIPLGFDNREFVNALHSHRRLQLTENFRAFIIEHPCRTIEQVSMVEVKDEQ